MFIFEWANMVRSLVFTIIGWSES